MRLIPPIFSQRRYTLGTPVTRYTRREAYTQGGIGRHTYLHTQGGIYTIRGSREPPVTRVITVKRLPRASLASQDCY